MCWEREGQGAERSMTRSGDARPHTNPQAVDVDVSISPGTVDVETPEVDAPDAPDVDVDGEVNETPDGDDAASPS